MSRELGGAQNLHLVPSDIRDLYEIHEWRNAIAILHTVHPQEWEEIVSVLRSFRILESFINVGGGNKSQVSGRIDDALYTLGWKESHFDTEIIVDGRPYKSPTHKVDCFKNSVALEIEWNNKDPFYDRDLNNFRLLFELRVVEVGVIVTRSDELKDIFRELGRYGSYGEATTHMGKLLPKVEGGGAGVCPVVVFGLTKKLYVPGQ